jgi:hypothetical protein
MSRDELLELAALDAFGLLDEYESALYTRSFHHAPAAVQDEIKRLQAEFAGDESMLPDVANDAALRRRVLEAVAKAIESESAELAPLAMIGRTRRDPSEAVARIGLGTTAQFWRAASFVLGSLLVASLIFGGRLYEDLKGLSEEVVKRDTLDEAKARIGGEYFSDYVNNPRCTPLVMHVPEGGEPAIAVGWVYVKEEETEDGTTFSLFLRTEDLAPETSYTLTALDGRDQKLEMAFDTGVSRFSGERLTGLAASVANVAAALTWKVTDAAGNVVLIYS